MTTQNPVRVGFIGTGWTERVQIPMFRLGGLKIQAVCAMRPENARRVAQKLNIPDVYENWQDLISAKNVDLVSIVTPPHLHREMAEAALRAGKHVICEKPIALNTAEAEAMLAAAQAAPNQLAIIDHELRFHPQRIYLRHLIRSGYIGATMLIQIVAHNGSRLDPNTPWGWVHDAEQGGGLLGAMGSHMLDLARWLNGKIESLTATLQTGHYYRKDPQTGNRRMVSADDHAHLMLRFANGVHGTITVSGLMPGPSRSEIVIIGTKGALRLDSHEQLWGLQGEDFVQGNWQPLATGFPPELPDGVPTMQPFAVGSYFLARVLAENLPTGQTVITDAASFYDGLSVQRAMDAARQSYQEQSWVHL